MFENTAKGWHGSYSIVGRSSAEKYHLILIKDIILSGRVKKKKIKTIFSPDKTDKKEKLKNENKIDIFEEPPIKEKKERIHEYLAKRKEICEPYSALNIPEKYKYHQHHHRELHNYNIIMKQSKKFTTGSGNYNPKMDYIWRKTITGPSWNIISGREKKIIKSKDNVLLNEKLKEKNKIKKSMDETEKISKPNLTLDSIKNLNKMENLLECKKINTTFFQKFYGVPMIKQTKRGDLPITYDLRIRNDKPYILSESDKNNNNSNETKKDKNREELTDITKISRNINKSKSRIKSKEEEQKFRKKNTKIIKCIDFSKGLSREQYSMFKTSKDIHPFNTPKYSQVESRCLTMVSYSSQLNQKKLRKKFKGVDNTLFFNPDKVINKVNNHKEVSVPNFKIMVSRPDDKSPLPSYMINKFDRASLETVTQKGLKMNGYANVGFKTYTSSFYPKSSFNKVINYKLLNSDKFVDSNLDGLLDKMKDNPHMRKLIEFYSSNAEDNFENNNSNFDAITFKTIHPEKKRRTKFY
jgi:hypothetical protein